MSIKIVIQYNIFDIFKVLHPGRCYLLSIVDCSSFSSSLLLPAGSVSLTVDDLPLGSLTDIGDAGAVPGVVEEGESWKYFMGQLW